MGIQIVLRPQLRFACYTVMFRWDSVVSYNFASPGRDDLRVIMARELRPEIKRNEITRNEWNRGTIRDPRVVISSY